MRSLALKPELKVTDTFAERSVIGLRTQLEKYEVGKAYKHVLRV